MDNQTNQKADWDQVLYGVLLLIPGIMLLGQQKTPMAIACLIVGTLGLLVGFAPLIITSPILIIAKAIDTIAVSIMIIFLFLSGNLSTEGILAPMKYPLVVYGLSLILIISAISDIKGYYNLKKRG